MCVPQLRQTSSAPGQFNCSNCIALRRVCACASWQHLRLANGSSANTSHLIDRFCSLRSITRMHPTSNWGPMQTRMGTWQTASAPPTLLLEIRRTHKCAFASHLFDINHFRQFARFAASCSICGRRHNPAILASHHRELGQARTLKAHPLVAGPKVATFPFLSNMAEFVCSLLLAVIYLNLSPPLRLKVAAIPASICAGESSKST